MFYENTMAKIDAIKRYNLIINKLRKYPATYNEIDTYLEKQSELQEYKLTVSKRTFQRDLDEIRLLYSIDIRFDFSKQVYYIDDAGQPDFNNRLLEAFDTFNALKVTDSIYQYMNFETRKPLGTENLNGFIHAIKNNVRIKFTYQKFQDDEISKRTVEPYLLKEFKNRWYVLAKDLNDGTVKSFAIDRISLLEITNQKFQVDSEYNLEDTYKHSFGIISSNESLPDEIILSFNTYQGKYIKTLPLHDSQKILIDDENEFKISLQLIVTHDLIMELLSFGDNLKVIQPQKLIDEMKNIFQNVLKKYEE